MFLVSACLLGVSDWDRESKSIRLGWGLRVQEVLTSERGVRVGCASFGDHRMKQRDPRKAGETKSGQGGKLRSLLGSMCT